VGRTASPPRKIPVADGPDALLPLSSFRNRSFALADVSALAVAFVPVTLFAIVRRSYQEDLQRAAARAGLPPEFIPYSLRHL